MRVSALSVHPERKLRCKKNKRAFCCHPLKRFFCDSPDGHSSLLSGALPPLSKSPLKLTPYNIRWFYLGYAAHLSHGVSARQPAGDVHLSEHQRIVVASSDLTDQFHS